jgi:uncharacterized protein (DUF1800 family)
MFDGAMTAGTELLDARATNARLLRRLVMAPTPDLVESFDAASPAELVETILQAAPLDPTSPALGTDDDYAVPTRWWLDVMLDPSSGFHERMIWFWHGHLTSGLDKASPYEMVDQLALLRRGATGNFRELLREITLDPAMLSWLDGAGSTVTAPNENYARELMELFAFGRDSGVYTERDVKAGAKALAGYWVDNPDGEGRGVVVFDADGALSRPVEFLAGRVQTVDDVIDAVCDHPACASYISGRLFDHLVGGELSPELHESLAANFLASGLDIAQLARDIVTDSTFLAGPALRARSAVEWFLAFRNLTGAEIDIWPLESLGQMPLNPPNVAGWPGTQRWMSSGILLTKGQIALDNSWDTETLDETDPVGDVLRRAVLYVVSPETRSALDELASAVEGRREQSTLLHAAVAMSPEFSLI